MKRQILLVTLSIAVLAGIAATIYLFIQDLPPVFGEVKAYELTDTINEARVVEELGDSTLQREGTDLAIDSEISIVEGDTIVVPEGSEATLYWVDGSLSRMTGPAELLVTSMHFTEGEELQVDMEIKSGDVWTKVLNMLTEESTVQIRSQSTVAGIRGTIIRHQVSGTGTVITPYEHALFVQSDQENSVVIEGQSYIMAVENEEPLIIDADLDVDYEEMQKAKDRTHINAVSTSRRSQLKELGDTYSQDMIEAYTSKMEEGNTLVSDDSLRVLLDYYAAAIASAYLQSDIGAIETNTDIYAEILVLLEGRASSEDETKRLSRQIDRHARGILIDDTPLDLISFKEIVTRYKVELAATHNQEEILRRILTKEVYYANDLHKSGQNVAAEIVIEGIRNLHPIMRPIFSNAGSSEAEAVRKYLDRIEQALPNAQAATRDIQSTIFPSNIQEEIKKAVMERDAATLQSYYDGLTISEKQVFMNQYPSIKDLLPTKEDEASEVEEDIRIQPSRLEVIEKVTTNANLNVKVKQSITTNKNTNTAVSTNLNTNVLPIKTNTNVAAPKETATTPKEVSSPVVTSPEPLPIKETIVPDLTPTRSTISASR